MRVEEEYFVATLFWNTRRHETGESGAAIVILNIFVQLEVKVIAQAPHIVVDFGKVCGGHVLLI